MRKREVGLDRSGDHPGERADTGVVMGNGVMVLVLDGELGDSRVHVGGGPRSDEK